MLFIFRLAVWLRRSGRAVAHLEANCEWNIMFDYRICGLTASSEIELPGAIADASRPKDTDITIRRGFVPLSLADSTSTGPTWEIANETFLLRVPRLARFLMTAGRDIEVDLEPGALERDATGFILGTAFGILLHQRGALVLHGAAVAMGQRSIAICGASGAGKSTLAAALCRDGFTFVTDDLCVIGLDENRRPVVLPDGRRLKLWKDAIDRLDLATRQGEVVREQFQKYYIEPFETVTKPAKLAAIYVLREARPPLKAGIEGLSLPDAIRTLDYEAYRPGLRAKMGQKPEMLRQAAALLGHTRVFRLVRPRGFEHMPETVDALRAHWDALD
jgi:hypothetical protein